MRHVSSRNSFAAGRLRSTCTTLLLLYLNEKVHVELPGLRCVVAKHLSFLSGFLNRRWYFALSNIPSQKRLLAEAREAELAARLPVAMRQNVNLFHLFLFILYLC